MFIIDKPFVSEFLLNTIKESNYSVVSTEAAKELLLDDSLSWVSEEQAARHLKENPQTPLYTNSENALSWIFNHLNDSPYAQQAQLFKDKLRFRKLIKASFPDFFFKTIGLKDIHSLNPETLPYPFVIKPSVGFFSIGVHVVKNEAHWALARKELSLEKLRSIFPSSVLDTSLFIIEEYIEGEEYAVDCYYNQSGEAVVLNIFHHKFSSGADTSDRVYTTSLDIIHKHKDSFSEFLQTLGRQAGLKNFPAHVELRVDGEGVINPIEINPLRFGGWCTTADLLGIATGFSPYEFYLQNKQPDWEEVFKEKENNKYSIVVLNNNSGYSPDEIEHFDYKLLAGDFEKPLMIRELDVRNFPVFGFVFVETRAGNESELNNILVSDLRKYITVK